MPPVRRPGYRDPTECVDWEQERLHQAFVRNHLYRGPGLPFGVLVMIFVLVGDKLERHVATQEAWDEAQSTEGFDLRSIERVQRFIQKRKNISSIQS